MKKLKAILGRMIRDIRESVVDDTRRQVLMFLWMNRTMAVVSFVMSFVNAITGEHLLMTITLAYSVLCVVNTVLLRAGIKRHYVAVAFGTEALVLLGFFFISGVLDGFSAFWISLIPAFSLMIFGRKKGSLFCLLAFGMMVFLLWTPPGKGLVQYEYSQAFRLRLPFFYIAVYLLSIIVECFRSETKNQLMDAQEKYRYLYCHDELTGLYNRYAFRELMDEILCSPGQEGFSLLIMDIDDFKCINDRYGHIAGDAVLREVAALQKVFLPSGCGFCRWGGEEFAVLVDNDRNAAELGERLRACVEKTTVTYGGEQIRVTVSVGACAVLNASGYTATQIFNQADTCMYQAKARGKNSVCTIILE